MISRLCRPVTREIWRELSVAKMSQRSITSFFSGPKTNSQKPSNGVVTAAKKAVTECSPLKQERKRVMRVISDSEEENDDGNSKVVESLDSKNPKSAGEKEGPSSPASQKPAVNGAKNLKRKASPPLQASKKVKVEVSPEGEAKSGTEDEPMSEDEPASEDVAKLASEVVSPSVDTKKTAKPASRKKSAVLESVGRRTGKRPSKAASAAKVKKGKGAVQKGGGKVAEKTVIDLTDSKQESEGSEAKKPNGENSDSQDVEESDIGSNEKKITEDTTAKKGKTRSTKAPPGRRKSGASGKNSSTKGKKGSSVNAQTEDGDIEDVVEEPTEAAASKRGTSKTPKRKSSGTKATGKGSDKKLESGTKGGSKSESSPSKTEDSDKKEVTASPNTSMNEDSPTTSDEKVSPLNYNSARPKYHPITHACWERGEKVPYIALAKTLEAIENTSARLKRIEIMSNLLRSVLVLTPEDLVPCVYLCLNKLAPAYEGVELGVGDMVLLKAVAQSTGRTLAKLRAEVAAKGDLGLVAESSRSSQKMMFKPAPLTVRGVFAKLLEIARMTGNSSMSKKMDKIQSMFVACRGCETRYLIRSLGGKLRIGLAEQSVLAAIAQAAVLTPPCQDFPPEIVNSSKSMSADKYKKKLEEASLIVKTTYCECPTYDKILGVLLKEGVAALPDSCHITPGVPMKPMLAHPTKGVSEVLQRFDKAKFTCEFKYDGERAQIHVLENGDIHIYSRNQENNTSKYPDVIRRLPRAVKEGTRSCILDSEMVAWDADKKQILPFQVLSTRKKKDASESEIKVQVCIYAFDVLYLNGESLVKKPFSERRQALHDAFTEVEGEFTFVKSMDADDTEKIEEFLEESIKGNCEGLMVKSLDVDATYEIAKRSHNWLKLKKDYLEGTGDTLDLVVIGGYHGKGKRTGSYGGFLLACYDETNEEFQSICKLGTGFKDEDLEKHSKFFQDHIIDSPKSYYRWDNAVAPDVWFDAVQVWEIKCADLSISPVHKAALGLVDPTKGISLRFPRFLRIREDKSSETATNSEQVAAMYNSQEQVKNRQSANTTNEDAEEDEY